MLKMDEQQAIRLLKAGTVQAVQIGSQSAA